MSDAPQIPVNETRAEDVKPLELPADSAVPSTNASEPILANEDKNVDETPSALPEQTTNVTSTGLAAEEPLKEEKKGAEPVTAGVLGYKAPGLLKQFKFSKRYFWIGDEAVSTQHLSNYLRGTEPKSAQPVAAWSSHTGKGLLYMVKNESEKSHPQEVLCLADAYDLEKHGALEFSFKVYPNEKHTFKASTDAEAEGWYHSIETGIAEAKESKDTIMKSDKYQETIKHLGAPAAAVGGVAAVKAHEHKKDEAKEETPATAAATEPVEEHEPRTGSLSDDGLKKETKSRSQSRKRDSIFSALKGKKQDHDVKSAVKKEEKEEKKEAKEEKKEEKKEAKEEKKEAKAEDKADKHLAEGAAVGGTAVAGTVVAADESKPTEAVEEPKTEAARPKRNSIFGSFYQKVRSPASEKKESDVMPIIAPQEETSAVEPVEPTKESTEAFTDAPEKFDEPVVESKGEEIAPITDASAISAPVAEEKKVETPKKEKESFLGGLLSKARAKSPAARKSEEKREVPIISTDAPPIPAKDEARLEEAAPATTTQPTAEEIAARVVAAPTIGEALEEPKKDEIVADQEIKSATPKEGRRRSYFGSLGQKKEKTEGETEGEKSGEKSSGKFGSMFRKPSQLIRSSTTERLNKKENVAPQTTEETAATEATPETAVPETTASETNPVESSELHKQTIGDVGPESITVGQPQNPTVSASA